MNGTKLMEQHFLPLKLSLIPETMITATKPTPTSTLERDPAVQAHFHAAAELYHRWSPEGHLHFGYWEPGMCALRRGPMLARLVDRVMEEIHPMPGDLLADLGCGYGAAARHVAKSRPGNWVDGFTVVPEQVQEGRVRILADGLADRVDLHVRDFRDTGLGTGSVDGAFALESMCYASGPDKRDLVEELHRILRPGGRFAVTDGFVMKPLRKNGLRDRLLGEVCSGWAVPEFTQLHPFLRALKETGFTNVAVTDLSFRVAPSAFHAPHLVVRCLLDRWVAGGSFDAGERAHLRSCLLGLLLGTLRGTFRYLLISGTRT